MKEKKADIMENKTFSYSYSAKTNKEVEMIRKKYIPHEESKFEILKRLDRRAQNAGMIEGLCIGIVGALVFGIGMCFGFDVLEVADYLAILFCALGVVAMLPAYPVYRHISGKTRTKLTPEILRLSEEIMRF